MADSSYKEGRGLTAEESSPFTMNNVVRLGPPCNMYKVFHTAALSVLPWLIATAAGHRASNKTLFHSTRMKMTEYLSSVIAAAHFPSIFLFLLLLLLNRAGSTIVVCTSRATIARSLI
jgi:hypothetical protein